MRLTDLPIAVRRCGLGGALSLFVSRRKLRRWLPESGTLRISGLEFPFLFRRVSSDKYVIAEVLFGQQYACLTRDREDAATILDIGANIGTASVYFLNRYPRSRVIALEPDPMNFAVLSRNLEPYGARATAIQAALWPRPAWLTIDRGHFRDGGEWSTQVIEAPIGRGPSVQGLTLRDLIGHFGLTTIDILKVDIEGAERYVLDGTFGQILPLVKILGIELHDQLCRERFFSTIASCSGTTEQHGEVTVWTRRQGA